MLLGLDLRVLAADRREWGILALEGAGVEGLALLIQPSEGTINGHRHSRTLAGLMMALLL